MIYLNETIKSLIWMFHRYQVEYQNTESCMKCPVILNSWPRQNARLIYVIFVVIAFVNSLIFRSSPQINSVKGRRIYQLGRRWFGVNQWLPLKYWFSRQKLDYNISSGKWRRKIYLRNIYFCRSALVAMTLHLFWYNVKD